jgi:motility quorum-sensing regulator / GCU-specific mRNA interferase toxin
MGVKKHPGTFKRKPTYLLEEIKKLIYDGKTHSPGWPVIESGSNLGFSIEEMHEQVLTLDIKDFYKSDPDFHNHKVWQDAYKKKIKGKSIYIKFKLFDGKFLLTSFKPDTPDTDDWRM